MTPDDVLDLKDVIFPSEQVHPALRDQAEERTRLDDDQPQSHGARARRRRH